MKCNDKTCGFTMIEMLVSMAVASVLLVITVAWIHQSMKFASVIRQRQRQHSSLTRLARELRDNVRDCQSVSLADENQLILDAEGRQITYKISDTSLYVEKRDQAANGVPAVSRDTFILSPNSIIRWETSELPDWISLIVTRGPEGITSGTSPTAEIDDRRPVPDQSLPVDLHVRVAPNRWTTGTAEEAIETGPKERK